MSNADIRRAVSETRLKTIKLADSDKWKILNKELILGKTVPARQLVVDLIEENKKIARKLSFIDGILYRKYYRNVKHSNY